MSSHAEYGIALDVLSRDGVRQLTTFALEKRCHPTWYRTDELSLAAEVEHQRIEDVISVLVDIGLYQRDDSGAQPRYRPNEDSHAATDLEDLDHIVHMGVNGNDMMTEHYGTADD